MAVQLYAYDSAGVRHEIDLYEEEPIKLTISAENIQDVQQVDSAYSRGFRIPANQNNSALFSWWYEVNTIDFDVTQKILAEIYVDGLLYKKGHIRIEAAYINQGADNVDLEVVFYGETRDFSLQVGDGFLDSLNTTDSNHDFDIDALENSWLDFGDPALTADGVVRYIVAERGYNYDDSGVITQSPDAQAEIAIAPTGSPISHDFSFHKPAHPMLLKQFSPIVQVKYILDKIFEETDYSYSADSVFNEEWFKYLYTDGLPDASPFITQYNSDVDYNLGLPVNLTNGVEINVKYLDLQADPSRAYNRNTGVYTALATDTSITIDAELQYSVLSPFPFVNVAFDMDIRKNGVALGGTAHFDDSGIFSIAGTASVTATIPVTAGDQITVTCKASSIFPTLSAAIVSGSMQVNGTATSMKVNKLLKPDVKKIDFLKGILTKFRLVMVPSKYDEKTFIIKPWVNYIGTGDKFDWTHKLDESKDTVLVPLFYDQTATVIFEDQTDEDFTNKDFFQGNGYPYGRLIFDSENELLIDTKTITDVFAPTPVLQVRNLPPSSDFIIPIFAHPGEEPSDHGDAQFVPLKPKPRLLFWNGLAYIESSLTGPNNDEEWFYTDGGTPKSSNDAPLYDSTLNQGRYPRATDVSELPTTSTTLNLNWFKEFAYYDVNRTSPIGTEGESVYTRFWDYYIQTIYSSRARMMSAYFTIDAQDLRDLTFDDAIFIKNSWWRVLKIYDAPLTDIATVKVDLIKLLEYPGAQSGILGDGTYDGTSGGGTWGPTSGTSGGNWGGSSSGTDGTGGNTSGSSGSSGLQTRYYELYDCLGEMLPIIGSFTGGVQPTIGYVCQVSGIDYAEKCFIIQREVQGPAMTTILATFPTCIECGV